jgi:hypothetical protein
MADPTNMERAGRAYKMLRHYQDKIRKDQEDDVQTILGDALADMMHLARFEKLDWDHILKAATGYYEDELEQSPESPRSWSPRGWRGTK